MWIAKLALSRPYTFIVLALVLILISPVMLLRTPVDIFPNINIPVISVIWTYSGLAPAEMATRIVSISEQQLNDFGLNFIRPQLATVQGASVPIPYGGKVRQIMVDIDSQKLLAKGLSPTDVVNAVNTQNVVLPSGTAKIGSTEYNVGLNGNPL